MTVIKDLVEISPDCLRVRDGSGRLPLHIALDREKPRSEVVELLLNAYPEAASSRRGVGRLVRLYISLNHIKLIYLLFQIITFKVSFFSNYFIFIFLDNM